MSLKANLAASVEALSAQSAKESAKLRDMQTEADELDKAIRIQKTLANDLANDHYTAKKALAEIEARDNPVAKPTKEIKSSGAVGESE